MQINNYLLLISFIPAYLKLNSIYEKNLTNNNYNTSIMTKLNQ